MPEIKFTHVVSCSSDDKQYPAENLLRPQSYKKWKCKPGENQASVILQLERAIQLQSLDIGNEGSAFVEILGGRSTSTDDDYKVILPTAGFMTPEESRKESNLNGVRFFDSEKFTAEGRTEKWDRLKLLCTQPFNKNLAFGISFIKVHAVPSDDDREKEKAMGKIKFRDDVDESGVLKATGSSFAPGSLFMARHKTSTEEPSSTPTPSSRRSIEKKESFFYGSEKRKSKDSKNGDGAEKTTEPKKRKPAQSPKQESTPPEPKKPAKDTKEKRPSAKTVPFDKLLDGVVFAISGFQNPLRSDLREQAMEMGAIYRADWGPDCTHLICAFANTPKYNQVKGKGKIVKKEWISDSHKKRKKMDWRKYSFEKVDAPSSDEELVADDGKQKPEASNNGVGKSDVSENPKKTIKNKQDNGDSDVNTKAPIPSTKPKPTSTFDVYSAPTDYSSSGADTDDEIERVRAKQRRTSVPKPSPSSQSKSTSPKKVKASDLPELPEFFKGMRFFLYGGFPDSERKQLNRLIVAFDGAVEPYMGERVTHVLTRERWDDSFDEALNDFPKIVFLRPDFVLSCGRSERMVDIDAYMVKRR